MKNNVRLKLAVLSIPFVTMSNSFISPALAQVAAAFPQASPTSIQLIMTFAMFGQFPLTLITGGIANRVRSKVIVVIALAALLTGGLLPIVLNSSLIYLYLSAALMGAGQGALLTMMSVLAAEYFEGDERSKMFGYQGAVQNAGSMIMTPVAGFLAAMVWSRVYFTSVLIIPTFLLVILFLPMGKSPAERAAESPQAAKKKGGIAPAAVPVALFIYLLTVGFATNILNAAMLLTETGMGDSATTGVVMSLASLVGIAAGIIYKQISGALRQYILAFAALFCAAGVLIAGSAVLLSLYFVGAVFLGIAFAVGFSGGMDCMAKVVPPEKIPGSMGLFMALQALGAMTSPYIINTLTVLVFGELSAKRAYMTSAGFMACIVVLYVLWGIANRRYFAKKAPVPA